MPLQFDDLCKAAVDLAKRAVPLNAELDAGLLLAALYHVANLQPRFPQLGNFLAPPVPQREEVPDRVPLAKDLQPLFARLAARTQASSAEELFLELVKSESGRQALLAKGANATVLDSLLPGVAAAPPLDARERWRSSPERRKALQELSSYGRMLTEAEPPHGQLTGRDATVKAIVRTLSHYRRRNAILVGASGTGKSAVIYELARRILRNDPSLPAPIRAMDIFELSPSFLRSGASMVGQYDERVKGLLKVLTENRPIILFVDEIHSLLQSGIHERGPYTDANESFKGALGRGEITVLGCTTPAEYKCHIEPDAALQRRFSIIRLDPPSRELTLHILQARRVKMEQYYAPLKIPDALLAAVVELTEKHLPSRHQPDKSLQLLDDACAFCATAEDRPNEVADVHLRLALQDMVGHGIVYAENLTEDGVFKQLRENIVGQDEALHEVSKAFVAALHGWTGRSGPRAVFLFGGPTGVGKTETALLLAKVLGGDRPSLIRVDCNTLQGHDHDTGPVVNRLLGVPPGYLGFVRGQGGILSRVRDFPESIVLFDEFEKAGPAVGRLLLQIIDEGKVEDSEGNPLDFRRSFIIFTTNAGCVYETPPAIGFVTEEPPPPHADVQAMRRELRRAGHAEEFLGRLSHPILFRGLGTESIREILSRQLTRLQEGPDLHGFRLAWTDDVLKHLAAQWQPRFGVRHMTTMLQHRLIEILGVADAQGELRGVETVRLQVAPLDRRRPSEITMGSAKGRREDKIFIIELD